MRMRRRPQQARRNVNQMATAAVAAAVSLSLSPSVFSVVVGRYKFRILSHRIAIIACLVYSPMGSSAASANSLRDALYTCFTLLDDDGSDAAAATAVIKQEGDNAITSASSSAAGGGLAVVDSVGRNSSSDEEVQPGSPASSLEDEVDSASSRDMNDFGSTTEREQSLLDDKRSNRLGDYYYERQSDNSSDGDGDGDGGGGAGTPQYRHSVTTNWSSSDEEPDKYRQERTSLFRRSETSSPDYFHTRQSSLSRGDLIIINNIINNIVKVSSARRERKNHHPEGPELFSLLFLCLLCVLRCCCGDSPFSMYNIPTLFIM